MKTLWEREKLCASFRFLCYFLLLFLCRLCPPILAQQHWLGLAVLQCSQTVSRGKTVQGQLMHLFAVHIPERTSNVFSIRTEQGTWSLLVGCSCTERPAQWCYREVWRFSRLLLRLQLCADVEPVFLCCVLYLLGSSSRSSHIKEVVESLWSKAPLWTLKLQLLFLDVLGRFWLRRHSFPHENLLIIYRIFACTH